MKLLKVEKGQTQIEYVLLISFVVIILILAIPPMRNAVANVIDRTIQIFRRYDEPSAIYPCKCLCCSSDNLHYHYELQDQAGNQPRLPAHIG